MTEINLLWGDYMIGKIKYNQCDMHYSTYYTDYIENSKIDLSKVYTEDKLRQINGTVNSYILKKCKISASNANIDNITNMFTCRLMLDEFYEEIKEDGLNKELRKDELNTLLEYPDTSGELRELYIRNKKKLNYAVNEYINEIVIDNKMKYLDENLVDNKFSIYVIKKVKGYYNKIDSCYKYIVLLNMFRDVINKNIIYDVEEDQSLNRIYKEFKYDIDNIIEKNKVDYLKFIEVNSIENEEIKIMVIFAFKQEVSKICEVLNIVINEF